MPDQTGMIWHFGETNILLCFSSSHKLLKESKKTILEIPLYETSFALFGVCFVSAQHKIIQIILFVEHLLDYRNVKEQNV